MKYILKPHIKPVGYLGRPYAMYDEKKHETSLLDREQFRILLKCSGESELDNDTLSKREAAFLQRLLRLHYIEPAQDGARRAVFRDYRFFANPYYRGVEWSITGACNSKCRHCFISARYGRYGNISTDKCLEICRQLGECGIRRISLTGGEPLLRKDFLALVDALTENGVYLEAVLTNGTLLRAELLEALHERSLRPVFQLSYDGVGHHDWMRGVEGAEARVIQAFDLLREYDFPVTVTMCLNRRNQHTIFETLQVCLAHGVGKFRVFQARSEGEFLNYPDEYLPYEEVLQRYAECIPLIVRAKIPIPVQLGDVLLLKANGKGCVHSYTKQLPAGKKNVSIRMDMDIYISPRGVCLPRFGLLTPETEIRYPNVFQTPLNEILSGKEYSDLSVCTAADYLQRNPECESCEHFRHCIMAWSGSGVVREAADLYRKNDEVCLYMKNGWREKLERIYSSAKSF